MTGELSDIAQLEDRVIALELLAPDTLLNQIVIMGALQLLIPANSDIYRLLLERIEHSKQTLLETQGRDV